MIRLADGLSLPDELVTQTLLIVGKRGSGKTNTCVRLAEQLHRAKQPFVVIDPVDVWWGLKASRNGKGPGLSGVYVFGGRHADLPLEPTGGVLVADTVIEHRISAVLSMKHFSGRERAHFVSDFADRLYRRAHGEPLHLFLEEAHEVAPQNPYKGEEEMLGRVTRIWKLGRSSGIGGSAITQRPASLNKNVTTQAEILIVHRMLGPQDIAAVREWIRYHGESEDVLADLSSLKTGEAWLWAPDFPEGDPIGLRRVKILLRDTFDSSATPKVGKHVREPKHLAKPDLRILEEKMAKTIERAKADDPKELRKKIAELERAAAKPSPRAASTSNVTVKVKKVGGPELRALRKELERYERRAEMVRESCGYVVLGMERLSKVIEGTAQPAPVMVKSYTPQPLKAVDPLPHLGTKQFANGLTPTQQRIIDTIGVLNARGIKADRVAVARWIGIHPNGGRYLTDLAELRKAGMIDGMELTGGAGLARVALTGADMALQAAGSSDASRRQVLQTVIDKGPLSRVDLAAALGIHPNGGRYLTNLARLREMGLISERGPIEATPGTFR